MAVTMKKRRTKPKAKNAVPPSGSLLDKWWIAVSRLVQVQLVCSLLMQLSYVAFPAYNFALALWCLACCTRSWSGAHPKLVPFQMLGIGISVVVDIIWMGLWVSGKIFYDQFCGTNGVSIVSCGGAPDYFPGCGTNRFSLFTLVLNDIAKVATIVAMHRIRGMMAAEQIKGEGSTGRDDKVAPVRSSSGGLRDGDALHRADRTVNIPQAP